MTTTAHTPPPVRIGLLGCADFAIRRMLPAIDRCPDTLLTAVASRDRSTARNTAQRFGACAAESYEAVLAAPDVEAVYVPVPAALHASWVERALLAGKHVLAEKPLTTAYSDTLRLAALAREAGLVLAENVLFVHHGQHAHVRRLLADGAIGELRAASATFTVPARPADDIRLRPELDGGALWDVGVYPLRAAMHLLGNDLEVIGATLTHHPEYEVDLGGAALLRRADGVTAQLTFGLDHQYESSYRLVGSTGRIELTHAFTPPAEHRPTIRLTTSAGVREITLDAQDQCTRAMASFAAAIREGRPGTEDAVVAQARLLDDLRRRATTSPAPEAP
ncbi:Gfo/Idh/MocA family oxidoreductase [Micromonospora sp. NPDC047134]|uniref:Gfo/Idh/MocA family protein n=1 Tax=Micromonospora sp. NPDC047134 TaxID=3154340 RepID=UPI0033E7ED81